MPRLTSLTKKRLEAMEEALTARLAGAIDGGIPREVYEQAQDWVSEQLAKRAR